LVLYLKRLAIRANLLRLVSQGVQACLASQEDQVIRKTQAHHHHQALPLLQARQTNLVHCHPQVFHRLIFSLLTFPLLASLLLALHLRAFHLQAFPLRAFPLRAFPLRAWHLLASHLRAFHLLVLQLLALHLLVFHHPVHLLQELMMVSATIFVGVLLELD